MPQISKIRIVNFQYNDGKRLIADELYDFESENKGPSDALINLANGGGKSVLVQLMMQPVIPRAKVAGRRIESFFTKTTDHCYVVIEWALDGSKMKLMTGIAMAASDSSVEPDSDRGFQIKYYTFISTYQNYRGFNNIINLPLSRKENGRFFPAPFDEVRNLAKKPNSGVERYSSEDSTRWQDRLAQYGIIQNEWRMIEELNSNEGGVSKYFEGLKTSDAVIDKMIVPRIEEKQNCYGSKDDSSLETMLLSYAKQFARQQDIIRERETCAGFYEMLSAAKTDAEELWKSNDSLEKCIEKLFAYADALGLEIEKQKEKAEQLSVEKNKLGEEIRHIRREKVSFEYYTCKEAFERESENLKTAEAAKEDKKATIEGAKKKLLLLECARYYGQLKVLKNKVRAVSEEITNRENNTESAARLASLKYSARLAIQAELERVVPELNSLQDEQNTIEASVAELAREIAALKKDIEYAQKDVTEENTRLEIKMNENDEAVEELGIGAFRMLDGNYQSDELEAWKAARQKKEKAVIEAIAAVQNKLQDMDMRKDVLPQEIADAKNVIRELQTDKKAIEQKLAEYHSREETTRKIFEKHGLDFELRFTDTAADYLNNRIALTEASVKTEQRRIDASEEALASAQRGTLHIPKAVIDYLDSTGLHYTAAEKYILTQQEQGNLSSEYCLNMIRMYPFVAYGVIMDSSDYETLCGDVNGHWLPSVLPVFTPEDIDRMMHDEGLAFKALAAYSEEYFRDNASYTDNLREALQKTREHVKLLEERRAALEADADAVKVFSVYDANWEAGTASGIKKLEESIFEQQAQIDKLQKELTDIKESIRKVLEEEKTLNSSLTEIRLALAVFDKLLNRLEEEKRLARNLESAERKLSEYIYKKGILDTEKTEREISLSSIGDRLKSEEATMQALRSASEKVKGAVEVVVIEGDWAGLLSQYEALLESQNADLKRLNDEKNRLLTEIAEKEKEIRDRECDEEEYKELVYAENLEQNAKASVKIAEREYQVAETEHTKASRSHGRAEASFETAVKSLGAFGVEALPMGEVGKDFDTRISDTEKKLSEIDKNSRGIAADLSKLEKIQGKAELISEQHNKPAKYTVITLEADYAAQLDSISKQIRDWMSSLAANQRKVEDGLKKMSEAYASASADIGIAITAMKNLLLNETVRGDRYYTLCEHIDANMHTVELRISQIDTDLKEFRKTKGDLIHQCFIQGRQMYEGLKQLSNSSKVKVQNKRRQMIKFDVPETVDENAAKAAITAEIDKGTDEIVAKMSEDAYAESEVRKIAARTVGSKRLLRKYVGMENIVLKAYKIDRNPDNSGYRTWEQTQINNSGAEKFVVYFAVILALMAYTGDDYDSSAGIGNRSVLILDNPFGPISSKHVLEPMFEISRNYNVQMICLSDISKSDILSCFDLVIRAVVKQFALSSKEQLTHEGNELIEHGFYRLEQINMF